LIGNNPFTAFFASFFLQSKEDQSAISHQASIIFSVVLTNHITFGNTIRTRTLTRQVTEARIKIAALNRMTQLGLPESYRVA
jgi:hypothetical protein